MNIAIIGYGYWGPNILRNFSARKDCTVRMVCDVRSERLEPVRKFYPAVEVSTNAADALHDPAMDAVCIITPVSTHFELAKDALLHDKHVLIEKPMTATSAQAEELINLSLQKKKVLMVDHTFLYTGAVKKIKSVIDSGEIGVMQYFDSTRINLGLFQPDVNVVWDLIPHDLSILNFICKDEPVSLNANGISHTANGQENIAYLTLHYDTNMIAHFNCSWTSPVKIRRTLIGGSKKVIIYDDVEPTEKVKIYDTSYQITSGGDEKKYSILVDYRTGDIFIPKIEKNEALADVAEDFIKAITENKKPVSDMYNGLKIVKVLEAAQRSIRERGAEVRLK